MEEVSTVIRSLADVLEAVEAVETDENNYEITSLKPRTNDLLAADTVGVELSLCVPFLTTDGSTRELTLTPEEVQLDDDGSLRVDLLVAATPDVEEGEEGSQTDQVSGAEFDADADPDSRSEGTATAANSESDSADEDADPTADGTTDSPAYQDPDRLRAAYEEYETFGEMTEALDVDVTPQTVRRYTIKYGIHEPGSGTGSDTAETLLDADPDSMSTAADGETDRESEEGDSSAARHSNNVQIVTDGEGGATTVERTALDESGPEDGTTAEQGATAVPTPPPSLASKDDAARGDSTSIEGDESDSAVDETPSVDVDLPDHLDIEDIKTTVQEAQTLYEAQQQLTLDRDEARRLLQELNLLDLVHGRATTRDIVSRTVEDINQRLASATRSASERTR